ncbi:MAG: type II secretion system protein [Candidatus Altimarinota bacterium]
MRRQKTGFTLIELSISVFILAIIIVGISFSIMKISQNFSDTTIKTDIFQDIKDFSFDTSLIQYNSGIIFTGGILLHNEKNGILIGSFLDNNQGYNYTFSYNPELYNKYYFGYFFLNQNMLSGVLNHHTNIEDLNYNNGKIYKKLIIKDLNILAYNDGDIFEIELNIFKRYMSNFAGKNKQEYFLKTEDYLKFNLNF